MPNFTENLMAINGLKSQRRTVLDAARTAIDSADTALYSAKMEEAGGLNTKIDALQNLLNEDARYQNASATPPMGENGAEPAQAQSATLVDMLGSNEYANAFALAVKNKVTPATAHGNEAYSILLNAMTETGGSPNGSQGGFLVPVEMQTQINILQRSQLALATLFNTETVTMPTGFRVYDTAPTKGFAKVAEMGTIVKDDQPCFKRVDYSIEDYSLIVPLSNDLLEDNTAGLMQYLARWAAKKATITENINLLALLNSLTATNLVAGKELIGLKRALNVTLDPSFAMTAKIVTNQNGFNFFDTLTDTSGKPLLQPVITDPTKYTLGGREIVVVSNAFLADDATAGAPVYVGDFTQFGTLFRRKNMELLTTNIGGNAWATNSTEARMIMRMDETLQDTAAATKLFIPKASIV